MNDGIHLEDRAALLRRDFDRSFAVPPECERADGERLIAVTIAGHPHALRLSEVTGLLAGRRIVPLPSSVSSFLGIAGYRSLIIPVFDVAVLLGYPPASEPRWIALAGTSELPIGLAFEHFEAQIRMTGNFGDGAVRDGAVVRSILSIAALLAALPQTSTPAPKET